MQTRFDLKCLRPVGRSVDATKPPAQAHKTPAAPAGRAHPIGGLSPPNGPFQNRFRLGRYKAGYPAARGYRGCRGFQVNRGWGCKMETFSMRFKNMKHAVLSILFLLGPAPVLAGDTYTVALTALGTNLNTKKTRTGLSLDRANGNCGNDAALYEELSQRPVRFRHKCTINKETDGNEGDGGGLQGTRPE